MINRLRRLADTNLTEEQQQSMKVTFDKAKGNIETIVRDINKATMAFSQNLQDNRSSIFMQLLENATVIKEASTKLAKEADDLIAAVNNTQQ